MVKRSKLKEMGEETVTELETVESLQKQVEENKSKIREIRKADSELNLQIAVGRMNEDTDDVKAEILRACYNYIANHRRR